MRSIRVLFITSRHDAPYRYRCEIPCLHLRSEGVAADILHIRDPRLPDYVTHCSVVILFRLPWSPRVEAVVSAARSAGAKVIFDIDDLVFDPEAARQLPFLSTASAIVRAQYKASAVRLFNTFRACDVFVGATPALARHAASLDKTAHVWPNLLHPKLVDVGRRICGLRKRLQRFPLIAYFSGSATHDDDVAMVFPALRRVMATRPDARLLLCGFLRRIEATADFAGRIIRVPFVDWRVQPWLIGLARVNIAPLSRIDSFSHAKSALKFFEAGAAGVPTVASPTEPFVDAISQGKNGYIAPDADGWFAAMNTLLDADVARRVGLAARETAIEKHSIAGHRQHLREFYREINGRIRHPTPGLLPMPRETADGPRAPSRVRSRLSQIARARAIAGIVRRAHRPELLNQSDPSRIEAGGNVVTLLDDEITGAAEGGDDLGISILRALRRRNELFAVFGDERQLKACGAMGFHAFHGDAPGWREIGPGAPALESMPLERLPRRFDRAFVSIAVRTDEDQGYSRLAWRARGGHDAVVDFPLVCDGMMHHYLVSLPFAAEGAPAGKATLRFEALPVPGAYRLDRIVFVAAAGEVAS